MAAEMGYLLGREDEVEAIGILNFLLKLNPEERHDFYQFTKGVEYGMKIAGLPTRSGGKDM